MNNRFEGVQYLTLLYITGMYKLVGNIHDSEDKDLRYDSLGLSCPRHNEGDQLKLMVLSPSSSEDWTWVLSQRNLSKSQKLQNILQI